MMNEFLGYISRIIHGVLKEYLSERLADEVTEAIMEEIFVIAKEG